MLKRTIATLYIATFSGFFALGEEAKPLQSAAAPASAPSSLPVPTNLGGGQQQPDSDVATAISPLTAIPVTEAASPLDQPVSGYRGEDEEVGTALQIVGRTFGITFIVEPEVKGKTTFTVEHGTVRDVIDSILHPYGYFYDERGGFITVKKYRTILYRVEYLQTQRSSSETASVTLSGGSNNGSGNSGGVSYGSGSNSSGANGQSGGGSNYTDQTQIQITAKNDSDVWTSLAADLKSMSKEDDTFFINRFSGIVGVRTTPRRHDEIFKPYIDDLNEIIGTPVDIEAQILEASLNDQDKLGFDWQQAATKLGGLTLSGSTNTDLLDVGASTLAPATVAGTIKIGQLTSLISALKEKGNVTVCSRPSLQTLNNQPAYVTNGTEQTFTTVNANFTVNQPGSTSTPYSTTQQNFQRDKYTFGVILKATPFVRRDGRITLDLMPSISKLSGITRESDNSATPIVDIKRLNAIITVSPGEAAVIGGIIQNEDSSATRSVPGLGAIPYLRHLFSTTANVHHRAQLIIIVTAHVHKKV